ncbi:hypothetical protein QBC46DRAFT_413616 [Diplogelasinospora grovesii]|uniref:Uncharacterized protein n=1 Tax=Diplogelasinospora grovesii TaxID=303347 RepID=A0AAN6MYE7_9PEZI|nr:hypothetical protein QBC46DRAFT_413616 [Diplogelasinospora grovesii]
MSSVPDEKVTAGPSGETNSPSPRETSDTEQAQPPTEGPKRMSAFHRLSRHFSRHRRPPPEVPANAIQHPVDTGEEENTKDEQPIDPSQPYTYFPRSFNFYFYFRAYPFATPWWSKGRGGDVFLGEHRRDRCCLLQINPMYSWSLQEPKSAEEGARVNGGGGDVYTLHGGRRSRAPALGELFSRYPFIQFTMTLPPVVNKDGTIREYPSTFGLPDAMGTFSFIAQVPDLTGSEIRPTEFSWRYLQSELLRELTGWNCA